MKILLRFLLPSFMLVVSVAAHAQSAPAATGAPRTANVFGQFNFDRPGQGAGWVMGGTVGADLARGGLFAYTGRLTANRWNSNIHIYTGLLGLRLVHRSPRYRPYVEGLLGPGHAGYQVFSPQSGQRVVTSAFGFAWQVNAGLDYPWKHRLYWRVVELDYGKIYAGPGVKTASISTGVVFRLW